MGFADPSPTRPKGIARGLGAVTSNKMRSVIGAIESAGIPTVDYDKLLAMFEGKHSKILVSRHAAAITRVCRVHERGFPLRDLPQLCELFRFAYDQVAAGKAKEFEEALCAVMRCELARFGNYPQPLRPRPSRTFPERAPTYPYPPISPSSQ